MSGRDDNDPRSPSWNSEMPCSRFRCKTQISSPKLEVIWTIHVGDVLAVELALDQGKATIHVLKDGNVAGSLIGGLTPRLRECLTQGVRFKATVSHVDGGLVQVQVEPR